MWSLSAILDKGDADWICSIGASIAGHEMTAALRFGKTDIWTPEWPTVQTHTPEQEMLLKLKYDRQLQYKGTVQVDMGYC